MIPSPSDAPRRELSSTNIALSEPVSTKYTVSEPEYASNLPYHYNFVNIDYSQEQWEHAREIARIFDESEDTGPRCMYNIPIMAKVCGAQAHILEPIFTYVLLEFESKAEVWDSPRRWRIGVHVARYNWELNNLLLVFRHNITERRDARLLSAAFEHWRNFARWCQEAEVRADHIQFQSKTKHRLQKWRVDTDVKVQIAKKAVELYDRRIMADALRRWHAETARVSAKTTTAESLEMKRLWRMVRDSVLRARALDARDRILLRSLWSQWTSSVHEIRTQKQKALELSQKATAEKYIGRWLRATANQENVDISFADQAQRYYESHTGRHALANMGMHTQWILDLSVLARLRDQRRLVRFAITEISTAYERHIIAVQLATKIASEHFLRDYWAMWCKIFNHERVRKLGILADTMAANRDYELVRRYMENWRMAAITADENQMSARVMAEETLLKSGLRKMREAVTQDNASRERAIHMHEAHLEENIWTYWKYQYWEHVQQSIDAEWTRDVRIDKPLMMAWYSRWRRNVTRIQSLSLVADTMLAQRNNQHVFDVFLDWKRRLNGSTSTDDDTFQNSILPNSNSSILTDPSNASSDFTDTMSPYRSMRPLWIHRGRSILSSPGGTRNNA